MSDVLGYYMKTKEAEIAEKDKLIAEKDKLIEEKDKLIEEKDKLIEEKDKAIAEIDKAIATKTDGFVTYLVNENKSNEEIKRIVKDVTDEFINKIRESIVTQ